MEITFQRVFSLSLSFPIGCLTWPFQLKVSLHLDFFYRNKKTELKKRNPLLKRRKEDKRIRQKNDTRATGQEFLRLSFVHPCQQQRFGLSNSRIPKAHIAEVTQTKKTHRLDRNDGSKQSFLSLFLSLDANQSDDIHTSSV